MLQLHDDFRVHYGELPSSFPHALIEAGMRVALTSRRR
jgi:hypothetical protein